MKTEMESTLGLSISASKESLFERRIEFHLARKPLNTFSTSNVDFQLETLNPNTSSQTPTKNQGLSSSSVKKADVGNRIEHGFDPELSFQITFRRIGAGLANLGNTCFLNSVLQCLTYTEPFAAYLQSGKHKSACRISGFCALCALQNHVNNALQSTGKILSPSHLVKNLRCISRNFRNARQEDAHEYMINLLESMHRCCLPSGVPSQSPSAYEKSLVHRIFGGHLRSQVKCAQCSYCSNTFDPFLDLSLEIVKADSLCRALANFTAIEQLDGGQKQYNCHRCKAKVKALKQLTVHKAPHVLTIHLKRFGSHILREKINKKVDFNSTLDLKPYVSDQYEEDLKYTLYGVLVHAGGNTHSGHYYCFVRTSSGMWYSLDDNRVLQVNEKTVLQQRAYMLFYVRDRKHYMIKKPLQSSIDNMLLNATRNKQPCIVSLASNGAPCDGEVGEEKSKNDFSPTVSKKVTSSSLEAYIPQSNGKIAIMCNGKTTVASSCEASTLHSDGKVTVQYNEKTTFTSSQEPSTPCSHEKVTVQCIEKTTFKSSLAASTQLFNRKAKVQINARPIVSTNFMTEASYEDSSLGSSEVSNVNCPSEVDGMLPFVGTDNAHSPGNNASGISMKIVKGNDLCKNIDKVKACDLPLNQAPKKLARHNKLMGMFSNRKLLYLTILKMQKRRKHRSRRRHLHHQSSLQKDLRESTISGDDESASEPENGITHHSRVTSIQLSDNMKKDQQRKADMASSCPKRGGQEIVMLATNESLEKKSRPLINHNDTREVDARDMRGIIQNADRKILASDLKVTTAAHWEGIEPFSDHNEFLNREDVKIGYVLDKWDEEYDQGKRKKMKQSIHSFGGPNLFQQMATMKVQSKKMKTDGTSSGNRPFRI